MDDQLTEPVQPAEESGQGGGGQDAPYAEYLNRIPEDVREQVEPIFKEWDGNVTRRFQEHSEFRQAWEPYEQSGISAIPPEEIPWLVQFRQALDDPQSIKQWYDSYAKEYGLAEQQGQPSADQQQAPTLDEFMGASDPQALQQMLKQELSPLQEQLQAMSQWREQQEYAARVAQAEQYVQGQLSELKEKHPEEFNEEAIEKLVGQYIDSDPQHAVQRAFADWQKIRAQIEREYAQGKASQPAPAESGGVPDATPDMPKTLEEAAVIARQRIRDSWRT